MVSLIFIIISIILFFLIRLLDAIKSGCFYSAKRQAKPKLLEKYIDNIHYVQTPLWYCVFGAFTVLLFCIFHITNAEKLYLNIISSFLISMGTSAMCGPFYQGFINVGCDKPFIDPNENSKMELADPISGKTKWITRFWRGKFRIYLAFVGLIAVIAGLFLMFY